MNIHKPTTSKHKSTSEIQIVTMSMRKEQYSPNPTT